MKRFLAVMLCICLLAGCGGEKDEKTNASAGGDAVPAADPYEGLALNPLTGEYISEEAAAKRPVAVVINNHHKALPQSGIGEADIMYEFLAEGEITRLIAVFREFSAVKIGPVRSARSYFTYVALDYDALFVHHGGSATGYAAIRDRGLDDLDGMVSAAFWRDSTRVNVPGMYEHSSYTDASDLNEAWKKAGYREELAGTLSPFEFYGENTVPEGGAGALKITVPYSDYQESSFAFDETKGLYTRLQNGEEQTDDNTKEPLKFKNVLIQFAKTSVVDSEGRRDIEMVGSGDGFYAVNGVYVPVKWSKESYASPTKWFAEDGSSLKINVGKSFICVCPIGQSVVFDGGSI